MGNREVNTSTPNRRLENCIWPNLYYQIEEDLIVRTPSRGSIVTGVTTSGTTTPVDPPSPSKELHEVPLPTDPLPELPGLPDVSEFNQ